MNTADIVSSSHVGRSSCTGVATAGILFLSGTGDGAATTGSAGLFCATGGDVGFLSAGEGADTGAGVLDVDAAGLGLEDAAPWSLANRFRRIYILYVSAMGYGLYCY